MTVHYKINGKNILEIEYTANGNPNPLMERFVEPVVGKVVQPFMQDYKYEIVEVWHGSKVCRGILVVDLKPHNESAKGAFKSQFPNFKN